MDRNELKVQALLERVAHHENQAADYRVEITILTTRLAEVENELKTTKEAHEAREELPDVPYPDSDK